MVKLELSEIQVRDLLKLVVTKQKQVKENGDRPYWRGIEYKLTEALPTVGKED